MDLQVAKCFPAMRDREAGGIANTDENRMVAQY